MATVQTETLLKAENKPEAEVLINLLDNMTNAQKVEMLSFMRGICFANSIESRREIDRTATKQPEGRRSDGSWRQRGLVLAPS